MSFLSYSPCLATPNGAALSHNYQAVNTARSDHLTNLLMLAGKKTSVKEAGTTSYFSAAITPTAITHHCNFKQTYMSYFAYACKTEGQNGISRLISELLRTLDSSLRDSLFVLQNEVF